MKEKINEGIAQIKFSFKLLAVWAVILFFCFFSLIPEAESGQVVNTEKIESALKSVLKNSLAQTFDNSVKLTRRKRLFRNITITKPVLTHDWILDLLNEASQKGEIPEGGVLILNIDAHMDFGSGRYTELFCEGSWDRKAFKEKFASKLMSSDFNKELKGKSKEEMQKLIDAQWNIALQRLEGTWCNVAINRGWAKHIPVIRPGTFDRFKQMPEIARAEVERLKSTKEPIWVTIDYDYFSCEEHYPQRNIYKMFHYEGKELYERLYAVVDFLIENGIEVQKLVPAVSPGYISSKADKSYIDNLTRLLKEAFRNDGRFSLQELAAMAKEDSQVTNYYLRTLIDLEVFAGTDKRDEEFDRNYILNYKIYSALEYKDFVENIKKLLKKNNFPLPENKIVSLKQKIKKMAKEFNLKAYISNERGL